MNLRTALIRLASNNPSLRPQILPLLREAREFSNDKTLHEYLHEHPNADPDNHWVKDQKKKKDKDTEEDDESDDKKIKVKVDKSLLKKRQPKLDSEDLSSYPPDAEAEDLAPQHREEIQGYDLDIVGDDARQAVEIARKIKEGIKKGSDACKVNPPVCEQNLGLTRDKMPQIEGEKTVKQMLGGMPEDEFKDLTSKVRKAQAKADKDGEKFDLKDVIPDGKKRDGWLDRSKGEAMVQAGADPDDDRTVLQQMLAHFADNGVKSEETEVPVGMLKATQREILADKVYGMADSHLKGKGPNGKPFSLVKGHNPIIVSRDGHILDGHHRYAALLTIDPKAKMKVKVIDMDMKDLLKEAQGVGGVFKADFAGVPLPEEDQKKYKSDAEAKFKQKSKGKEAALRASLIRLAHAKPELRKTLLEVLG